MKNKWKIVSETIFGRFIDGSSRVDILCKMWWMRKVAWHWYNQMVWWSTSRRYGCIWPSYEAFLGCHFQPRSKISYAGYEIRGRNLGLRDDEYVLTPHFWQFWAIADHIERRKSSKYILSMIPGLEVPFQARKKREIFVRRGLVCQARCRVDFSCCKDIWKTQGQLPLIRFLDISSATYTINFDRFMSLPVIVFGNLEYQAGCQRRYGG